MDQIAPELLMTLAGGAAGAAGRQAWETLRSLVVRRRPGGEPEEDGELTALAEAPDDAARAAELAEALALRARQDPAFAQALADWRRQAEALEGTTRTGSGNVHNSVSGGTQNTVIQARDVSGGIRPGS
ncbi:MULTISPECIES: hypothetical protein [Streptomyces]|uniref:hypothetical protein n=1 Tax=Streptomyces TaxID=1883 RepID=UPI00163D3035|nr:MULTISPECIES: hypothetical protein [Streptomyces]MBC2877647.1 hypothetical protein [Streptomyces sp. TYQ1024]UBI36123.1 hypothetical protein K7I03_06380 [Streptomyces mobaraensis]UKW28718.1 hypothetical protein MCU78_06365 [Streptomyces sp. TYQ1024]